MESPPTWSTLSGNEDRRPILTASSVNCDSECCLVSELPNTEEETRPVLREDLVLFSDTMCNANFNSLKKAPVWSESSSVECDSKHLVAIKPPPQFQDSPPSPLHNDLRVLDCRYKFEQTHITTTKDNGILPWLDAFASQLVSTICREALEVSYKVEWSIHCSEDCHPSDDFGERRSRGPSGRRLGPRLCWTPELSSFSPCHNRPGSRLSSSHNSLAANKADDSSFITSAMSHDVLMVGEITDMYNVPFDSDIYAVPIDMVRPLQEPRTPQRPKRHQRHHRKRRRHTSSSSQLEVDHVPQGHRIKNTNFINSSQLHILKSQRSISPDTSSDPGKRHSVPGSSAGRQMRSDRSEPIHMTLQEVRQYLQNLYSSSSDSSEHKPKIEPASPKHANNNEPTLKGLNSNLVPCVNNNVRKYKKTTCVINIKNKKAKESCEIQNKDTNSDLNTNDKDKHKKSSGRLGFSSNLKQTLCNIFRIRKPLSPEHVEHGRRAVVLQVVQEMDGPNSDHLIEAKAPFLKRALPPLPARNTADNPPNQSQEDVLLEGDDTEEFGEEPSMDFASSIEKVKDYGWYWGPISGEAAEKILSNEPDGSFIVRDSSDDHYIFSLTFKLNGCIRHVRIEHDQGNFSFGSCTKFKSHTIVDFIENAVEHSRSGRYLFFLHRRPVLGPMRVQLLHPVSRFKQVQSLQHMCRFVILKLVRKDLINTLPLPRRVIDYLSTPHYYSEQLLDDESSGPSPSPDEVVHVLSFVPPGLS